MKKYNDILETKKARKAEREAARAPKVDEKPKKKPILSRKKK